MSEQTQEKGKNYIKSNYVIPTCIIGVLFLVGLSIIGCVAFKVNIWSFGIIALLFMALILGLATLISLIATFREIGRKQAREYSDEMNEIWERITDLNNRLEKLENKNK